MSASAALSHLRSCYGLPVLRVHPGMQARLVFQSLEAVVFDLHWLGQNLVCPGEGCPACESYVARPKAFLIATVLVGEEWRPTLVECTPQALYRLEEQMVFDEMFVQPGTQALASRSAKRQPIKFQFEGWSGETDRTLSSSHRLLSALAVLFGLPLPRRDHSVAEYKEFVREFSCARLLSHV